MSKIWFDLTFPEAKIQSLILRCTITFLFSFPISVNEEVYSNKELVYVSSKPVLGIASMLMCVDEWKM